MTLILKNAIVIEYQNSKKETKPIDTSELQSIQSYCQAKGLTSLSISDLQKSKQESDKPTSYLPYILGVIGILVVIIIAYFLFRKKKE